MFACETFFVLTVHAVRDDFFAYVVCAGSIFSHGSC